MSARRPFPGPLLAVVMTLTSWFAMAAVLGLFGPPYDLASLGIAQTLGMGGVALLATFGVPPPHRERLGLRGFRPGWLAILLLLVPVSILGSEAENLARAALPPEAVADMVATQRNAAEQLAPASPLDMLAVVVTTIGLAPVLEEWLFRGVIQQGLVATLGRWWGVFTAAVLFATGHVGVGTHPLSWLVSAATVLATGVVLGLVRLATGSLLAAIVLHAAVNGVGVAAVALSGRLGVPGLGGPGAHVPAWLVLPALACVAAGVVVVARAAARAPSPPAVPDPGADGKGGAGAEGGPG